jgi:uncharacterized protein YutE (UPF0331/DUF86 family)
LKGEQSPFFFFARKRYRKEAIDFIPAENIIIARENMNRFVNLTAGLKKNIAEIKSALRDPDLLEDTGDRKFERIVYLFQSIAKSIIDMGNSIIIENDFRSPLNTADVFISLAEHNVIPLQIVPGLKKAAIMMPRLRTCDHSEILDAISHSIGDMKLCLAAFIKFRHPENPED